ncbi:MAG: glycosyl hydrolase family 28-related protein, partial [Bryobacteraceae bacterium]
MRTSISAVLCLLALASRPAFADSYYKLRLDDPQAAYVGPSGGDDTNAIQEAINRVSDTYHFGIVFLAPGNYRVTHTIYIWPMVRVIGYGATRPTLSLPDKAQGYADPKSENYLFFFSGSRTQTYRDVRPPDATPGTFYSALSNIDIHVGEGNPGAVAIRGTYAQHCFLAHIDFHIGSGLAAVHDSGNVMEDVRFFGGRYGVWSRTPSPGWQLTLVDSYFEGQREAAIRDQEAGLTLIRPQFHNVPSAVSIDDGVPEDLWIKDALFDHVSGPALIISLENNSRTEINVETATCHEVPVFALLRESGKRLNAPATVYRVASFTHGLTFAGIAATGHIKTQFNAAPLKSLPPPVASDLTPLPPAETWVNIRSLGAKGDGVADDTAAFRRAVAQHRTIYIPSGFYRITDTLSLRPDTVLIGLHPLATELIIPDGTPAFAGVGSPVPLIEAPGGAANIVMGIGLYTNGNNPRAVAAKWMSGTHSLMNDVRFLGGHGTVNLNRTRQNPYNNDHSADPDSNRRWDSQYPSLWV